MSDKWPEFRVDEFFLLRDLIREVRSINSGSSVIERLQRCIELADSLDSTDRDRRQLSFVHFLERLAIPEAFGSKPTKAS